MTTEQENKAIARKVPEDIATRGNVDLIDEITTENPVEHGAFGDVHGREDIREMVEHIRAGIPDFSATVEDVLAEDDRVAMRVTLRGTHDGGEFMGLEPTGRTFEVPNMVITRLEDGRIAERWQVADNLMMMNQLGAVEPPTE
jgi:predicted ester cyclase